MLRSLHVVSLAVVVLLIAGSRSDAQIASGTVVLSASLPDGAVAEGVSFEFSPADRISAARSVTIDESGPTTALSLAAGTYRVEVRLAGFRSGSQTLHVAPGEVLYLTAQMEPATGTVESLIVLTERFDAAYQMTFGQDDLDNLPGSRTVWSMLDIAHPFLISDRIENGGLWSAEPASIGGYGSSWTQTGFQIGGFDVSEPHSLGTPAFYPDLGVLQAVEVDAALMPAERRGPGPVITMIPRMPGPRWAGTAQAFVTPESLQSSASGGSVPSIARFDSWTDSSIVVGGPLGGHQLGLLASARMTRARRLERDESTLLRGDVRSLYAHVLGASAANDQLRIIAALNDSTRPYAARARFQDRNLEEHARAIMLQATWEHAGTRLWSVGGSYQRLSTDPNVDIAAIGGTVERLRDGAPLALTDFGERVRQRWDVTANTSPSLRRWGNRDHVLRFGATLGQASAATRPVAQPAFRELVNGQPARVWDVGYRGPESRWRALSASGFASDRIALTSRLAVDAGVRVDYDSGSADGSSSDIRWIDVSPRLSARWRLTDNDHVVIFGGYGRYPHRLPLSYFGVGDPAGPAGDVYRWDDANGDRRHDESELTRLAPVGGCCAGGQPNTIDADLRRPSTDEFLIGIERSAGAWRFRFAGMDRRERHLVALINVGVTSQDYSVTFVRDPGVDIAGRSGFQLLPIYNRNISSFGQDAYVLTNVAGMPSRYQGLDITIERRLVGRWHMRFGATAYRSEGTGANRGFLAVENDQGLTGEAFVVPNAQTSARGRLFFDRAYVIKLSGTYRAPHDVHLGLAARYQDGQPFTRLIIAEDLNQGPEIIQANPRGAQRFTYTLTVDARVEKELTLGGREFGVIFEAFNLLDTAKEVEEDVVTGPEFRTVTAVQPPRAIRFGVKFAF